MLISMKSTSFAGNRGNTIPLVCILHIKGSDVLHESNETAFYVYEMVPGGDCIVFASDKLIYD